MLRRTPLKWMVPFHPFVVGGRPSERGTLYRDNQINAYQRVNIIAICQRTEEEARMFWWLRLPDVGLLAAIMLFMWTMKAIRHGNNITLEWNQHKNRHEIGSMNYHEVWQRNSEMAEIFRYHRDLIDSTREEVGERPAIFDPPTAGGNVTWNDTYGKGGMPTLLGKNKKTSS